MRTITLALSLLLVSTAVLASGDRTRIHATAEDTQPLLAGMTAPGFEVRDLSGEQVLVDPTSLSKPVVMTFYRGGWCPYCNLHLAELRHAQEKLLEMGFDVWFLSIDKPTVLAESLTMGEVDYRLLSDSKLDATRKFGLAFQVPEELHQRYLKSDIDLEAASGEDHHVLPVPATYIIGTDGMITFAYVNTNFRVRISPEVLLAAAQVHVKGEDSRLRKRRAEQREGKQ